MTDTHTIEAAYERLSTALAVPPDADLLVQARVAQRRRRRRAAQGLASVVATAACVGGVALATAGAPAITGPTTTVPDATASNTTAPATTSDQVESDAAPCTSPLPASDHGVSLEQLGRLRDALNAALDRDGSGSAPAIGVRVQRDGQVTTAYLLDDQDNPTYALRADRTDADSKSYLLLTCS